MKASRYKQVCARWTNGFSIFPVARLKKKSDFPCWTPTSANDNGDNFAKGTGGDLLFHRKGAIIALSLLFLGCTACQLTERPENREGLSNDSRSYSYVSYQEDYIKRAALQTPGVKKADVYYTGRRLIVKITPDPGTRSDQYETIRREARRRIASAAPRNPVHVIIEPPKK